MFEAYRLNCHKSVFSSATTSLAMFLIGACFILGLSHLPEAIWLLCASILSLFVGRRFVSFRLIGFALLGLTWTCYSAQLFSTNQFPANYEGKDFVASGAISGLPVSTSGNIRFRFKIQAVQNDDLAVLLGKTVQLSCYRCPLSIQAGQRWNLTLRMKRPHGYASWGAYDYEKYLYRHRIIAKGYIRLKGENHFINDSSVSIHRSRQLLLDELQRVVGSGAGASIITALVIGVKSGFTTEQQAVLQSTGVSHLMAISGLHVGLAFTGIALLLSALMWPVARVFEYWPRQRLVLVPALAGSLCYAALAGFSVSTQRAIVMLSVYVLCKFLARDVNLLKVLLVAMVVLLLIDPFSILDVGFWLSCGAVAIISIASINKERLSLIQLQPKLWIGMLPLSVLFFGQVSMVSPLVNLIAVPIFCIVLIPVTLVTALVFSLGLDTIGTWGLQQLCAAFDVCFRVLEWANQLEFARVYATPLSWWQWLLFALLVVLYLMSVRGKGVLCLLLVASMFVNTAATLTDDELHVTLLDVGQGLAMVIETTNSVIVYDTGPKYSSGFTTADAVLLPFLRQRGIRRIDTLVVSHADNDHIGGLEAVSNAFELGNIITSRLDKVEGASECIAGQSWRHDQTTFSVISPDVNTPQGSNNRSCVIVLEHYGTKILLSGDIEKSVERYLVKNSPQLLNADILLVPHQGSKTSSTGAFLDTVSPKLAMLAAGYRNHYGHPHLSVVRRYQERHVELLSTIESGSVLLKINSRGWRKVLYRQRYARFWRNQKLPNRTHSLVEFHQQNKNVQ